MLSVGISGNQHQVQSSEGGPDAHHGARRRHPDRQEVKQVSDRTEERTSRRRHTFAAGGVTVGEKNETESLYSRYTAMGNSRILILYMKFKKNNEFKRQSRFELVVDKN